MQDKQHGEKKNAINTNHEIQKEAASFSCMSQKPSFSLMFISL